MRIGCLDSLARSDPLRLLCGRVAYHARPRSGRRGSEHARLIFPAVPAEEGTGSRTVRIGGGAYNYNYNTWFVRTQANAAEETRTRTLHWQTMLSVRSLRLGTAPVRRWLRPLCRHFSPMAWYGSQLKRSPLRTKIITSGGCHRYEVFPS